MPTKLWQFLQKYRLIYRFALPWVILNPIGKKTRHKIDLAATTEAFWTLDRAAVP